MSVVVGAVHAILLLIFGFAWSVSLVVAAVDSTNLSPSDIQSLNIFYNALSGDQWVYNVDPLVSYNGNPWNFSGSPNPCTEQWQGIECSDLILGEYRNLTTLSLNYVGAKGTIPSVLSNFTRLTFLQFYGNPGLEGTIPPFVGSLPALQHLEFTISRLKGSIPPELGLLSNLNHLAITDADLTGSIPWQLGSLSKLKTLIFLKVLLTGSLPVELADIPGLNYVSITFTNISGSIPSEFGRANQLQTLLLNNNALEGSIPSTFCIDAALGGNMTELTGFVTSRNFMTGTLPAQLGTLRKLKELRLDANYFYGSVPGSIGTLVRLELLRLAENNFYGTLPSQFFQLKSVYDLQLNYNHFSGSLSTNIGEMNKIKTLWMFNNSFSGPIPDTIGNLSTLTLLDLHSNHLSGSVPHSISHLSNITEINVGGNKLTSGLDTAFNASVQTNLVTVEVHDNEFEGTLPEELFDLPSLTTLVAVSNCFHGWLPENICSRSSLQGLILDGLQSSANCKHAVLPEVSSAYVLKNRFHGSLPQCLFELPGLTSLHLSGDGVTGHLPENATLGPLLFDLVLSHNALSGTIPLNFQQRNWRVIDLSNNRLDGTLSDSFLTDNSSTISYQPTPTHHQPSNVTLNPLIKLSNNRLSGAIPGSLHDRPNVNILGSNLFSCDYAKTDLPNHDRGKSNFQCGSNSFDVSYYLWMGFVAVVGLGAGLMWRGQREVSWVKETVENVTTWLRDHPSHPINYRKVCSASLVLCMSACVMTGLLVLLLVPWYFAANQVYGTYTHAYAWRVSAGYLSGKVVFGVELSLYVFLTAVFVRVTVVLATRYKKEFTLAALAAKKHLSSSSSSRITRSESNATLLSDIAESTTTTPNSATLTLTTPRSTSLTSSSSKSRTLLQRGAVYAGFVTINLTVVIGVNAAFVYVALKKNDNLQFITQVLISIFKLGWNSIAVPYMIRWVGKYISSSSSGVGQFNVMMFVSLFNNIAIPCLLVAVVSPDCFYAMIDAAGPVKSEYLTCAVYLGVGSSCKLQHVAIAAYDPPFRYDYQCSSGILSYYASAYIYLAISASLAVPLAKISGQQLLTRLLTRGTYPYRALAYFLPRILKPLPTNEDTVVSPPPSPSSNNVPSPSPSLSASSPVRASGNENQERFAYEGGHLAPLERRNSFDSAADSVNSINSENTVRQVKRNIYHPYFDANILIVSELTYLSILMTFGVIFPPIAVAMCATILSVALQSRLEVGRFLFLANRQNALKLIRIVDLESRLPLLLKKLRIAVFMILCFAFSFYTMFLFDTLADATSFAGSIWVIVVVPLFPLLFLGLNRLRVLYAPDESDEVAKEEVEMEGERGERHRATSLRLTGSLSLSTLPSESGGGSFMVINQLHQHHQHRHHRPSLSINNMRELHHNHQQVQVGGSSTNIAGGLCSRLSGRALPAAPTTPSFAASQEEVSIHASSVAPPAAVVHDNNERGGGGGGSVLTSQFMGDDQL